jgi:hypothetical protein
MTLDTTKLNDRELAIYNELFQVIAGLKQRVKDLEETIAAKQKIINNYADDVDKKISKVMRCNSGERVIRKRILEDDEEWIE